MTDQHRELVERLEAAARRQGHLQLTGPLLTEAATALSEALDERSSAYLAGLETGRAEGAIIKGELEAASFIIKLDGEKS